MEDFVRKTRGVRDITSLPLDTSHELDIVSDVKGKIYIKILNRYKELLFDNGTDQWVIDMLNNLEVDVEQLKEDILDVEQALTELPMIEDKLSTVETKLDQINTLFAQMQIDVQGLDLITAELEREVAQLALKDQELLDKINNLDLNVDLDILYSNSTDFGDYDYSTPQNLLYTIDYSKLSTNNYSFSPPAPYIKDYGDYFVLDANESSAVGIAKNCFVPFVTRLTKGKTYTLSVSMMVDDEFADNNVFASTLLHYSIYTGKYGETPASTDRLTYVNPSADMRNQWKRVSKVFNVSADQKDGDYVYLQLSQTANSKGKLYVRYDMMIQEGDQTSSQATVWKPNLLEAPYYLSKVALGENLIKPESQQPVTNSNYLINTYNIKPMVKGKKYTITLEGTKPATQVFRPFFTRATGDAWEVGDLQPVEGLTNVWSKTFTAADDSHPTTPQVQIYQVPNTSVGQCTIKWLKLEEGDTRTPNIPYYKYVGINTEASKNPYDYHWIPLAKSAETVDARLTKTISTYDTVNALQNNRLTALESKVVDTTWQNVTVTEPFTSVTQPQVKKQNGIVYMRGTISNGTGDCFTLPEGFRPPEGAYEMQFRLPCRSADASDYATMYVRPSGLCSIAGVNGTKPIFLSGIIFSTT